jgi:hypothetical protein
MAHLGPLPLACHPSAAKFVHKGLHNYTHVFLCHDATRRAVVPPYSGLYQVLSRREKTLQLLACGEPVTMSADRANPACILHEADCGNTTFNLAPNATPATEPSATQAATSYAGYILRSPSPLSLMLHPFPREQGGRCYVGTFNNTVLLLLAIFWRSAIYQISAKHGNVNVH